MMNNDFGEFLDYFMPSTGVDEKRKVIGRIILSTLAFGANLTNAKKAYIKIMKASENAFR